MRRLERWLAVGLLSFCLGGAALAQSGPPLPGFRSTIVNTFTMGGDGAMHPSGQIDPRRRYVLAGDPTQNYVAIRDEEGRTYLVRRGAIAWDPARLPTGLQSCSRLPSVGTGRSLETNGLAADQCGPR